MSFEDMLFALGQMKIATQGLTPSSKLGKDVGMDSLELVDLQCILEKMYGLDIPSRVFEEDLCLGNVVEQVNAQLNGSTKSQAPLAKR
ncbi:acyl carrier protein [Gloeobacter violaceus]|uniref:Acyl carrier protein n=1 Tax=Gloeobacter violaceus (strain ATCC 29082 / PCC 7421) TaxID=251221 RepID=Q7NCX2_GLOVI|nr:phosphopantetheine-binding protein [Gloeobacter violaceus]BAC90795.1 acyl carrier protein [Gloeobacter violaceus PCC 7421]